VGNALMSELNERQGRYTVRGRGLMIGIEFPEPVREIRNRLLNEFHIFTGFSGTNILRLLPPLSLLEEEAGRFAGSLLRIL